MADLQVVEVEDGVYYDTSNQEEGEEEICRRVADEITPHVGMKFNDLEEGVKFYKTYALACGFDVRRYTMKRWRDGTFKSQLLVCNREGTTWTKGKGESNTSGDKSEYFFL